MSDELNLSLPIDIVALLAPIPGERPTGPDLRDDLSGTSPYFDVRNMRSGAYAAEKDGLNFELAGPSHQVESARERSLELWGEVRRNAETLLRDKTKDVEILEWLIESLIRLEGFAGLHAGLVLAAKLLETYWDDIHHFPDPDDCTIKGLSFERLNSTLVAPVSLVPLSTPVGDEGALTLTALRTMQTAEAGLGAAEAVAFAGGRSFYQSLALDIRGSIAAWQRIDRTLQARMGHNAPRMSKLTALLAELEKMVQRMAGELLDPLADEPLRPAAEQGDVRAQFSLAVRLLHGSSADEVAEGITWLRKVAEQDDSDPTNGRYPQHMLAAIYGGVPSRFIQSTAKSLKLMPAPDYHEALKWYRRVAEAGSSEAKCAIGELYERGTPATPQNFGEAFQWYTKAVAGEDGLYFGTLELAEMHFHGRGVKQDYVEAARLYREIPFSGSAMLRLAWMHENGKGMPQDLAEACKWFILASEREGEIRAQGRAGRLRLESTWSDAQRMNAWGRYEQYKDELRARNGA